MVELKLPFGDEKIRNTAKISLVLTLAFVGVVNSATTMVTYQVSTSADDGFAQSAAVQDITSAFLKIGDERTYAVPYQMSAMRFNDVDIPRSATITGAYLKITSINTDYRHQIYGVIGAEASDNPADFSGRMIGAAALTAASVVWDYKTAWSPDTQYISGDISNVLQEVVNRSGFGSGNSIAIYYSTRELSGKGRSFASYEYSPSSVAVLEVTYETYTISGHILSTEAVPLEGVAVSAGADIEGDVTDATGYYELKVPLGWSGTVTPSKIDWGFSPVNLPYSNVSSDRVSEDYTAFQPNISGYVKDGSGTGIEGVSISADNGGGSDTTDATGYYEITVPYGWSGSVSANLLKWDITPDSYVYSNLTSNQIDQDFTAVYVGIIVKPDGTGDFATIQAAIDAAVNGDVVVLQPGTFTGEGNRDIDFLGKAITVRGATGDANDCVIDCQGTPAESHRGFNFVSAEDANSILEGLTITNGYGPEEDLSTNPSSVGGAIYCNNTNPVINNCILSYNSAQWRGGAIYNHYYSSPTITNCIVHHNSAYWGGGIYNKSYGSQIIRNCTVRNNSVSGSGGGIYNGDNNAHIDNCIIRDNYSANNGGGIANSITNFGGGQIITGCMIINNTARHYGAGVYNSNSSARIYECVISDNVITLSNNYPYGGGGICNYKSSPEIDRCIIKNHSGYFGGGIYNKDNSNTTLKNSVISFNSAYDGGGICNENSMISMSNCTIINNSASALGSAIYSYSSSAIITNSILWNNSSTQIYGIGYSISYSNLQGGYTGIGNIDIDPNFIDEYHLSIDSSCFNTGDPDYIGEPNEKDIDGNPRKAGRIDMGSDEVFFEDSAMLFLPNKNLDFQMGVFTGNESQSIQVNNYGELTLNWHIETPNDCNWLILEPLSGHTLSLEANEITLSIDHNNIDYGTYNCQFQVVDSNAANSPQIVTVNLEVLRPEISLSKTNYYFTAYGKSDDDVADQQLMITNTGYDTLNWQIDIPNDCNWLSVIPQSGQVTDGNSIVTLSVDPNKAPEYGYNYCTLQVIDPNASNSPQAVEVRLNVYGPTLSISPSALNIYAEKDKAAESAFVITNTGYGVLDWTIEVPNDCNWITSVSPISGACGSNESIEVTVTVDSNGLELGQSYQTQLIIDSPQVSPKNYNIYLEIYEPNEIHVPYDYPTLQQAVGAAQVYGDTIIVHPGKYAGCDTKGKSLTITSLDPNNPSIVAATIIGSGIYGIIYKGIIYKDATGFLELKGLSVIHDPEIYSSSYTGIVSHYGNTYIKNCTIKNWPEGGVNIWAFRDIGKAMIENCLISGNKVAGILTQFRAQNLNIDVNNCTITNTLPDIQGDMSGIRMDGYDNIKLNINNSILSNCKSPNDVEIAFNSIFSREMNYLEISNSCLPSGPNGIFIADTNYVNVSYGPGNIEADPCFVKDGYLNDNNTPSYANDDYWVEGDYHLKSQYGYWQQSSFAKMDADGDGFLDMTDFAVLAGEWGKTSQKQTMTSQPYYDYYQYLRADLDDSGTVDVNDLMIFCDNYLYYYDYGQWVNDNVTSPCIDAGDTNSDWTAELWPHGKCINMGAYGGTPQASMSNSTVGNIANLDNDVNDVVDYNDLDIFVKKWCYEELLLAEDLNRDGVVNSVDYGIFANNWLAGTMP